MDCTNQQGGGIIGFNCGKLIIKNCANNGNVTASSMSGGIIGGSRGGSWTAEVTLSIENCINIGNIKSSDNIAGGIIGLQGTLAAKNYLFIDNSLNLGNIAGIQKGNIIGKIDTYSNTETKTEFSNVYCAGTAIGAGTLTSGETTEKTLDEMKGQGFVDILNSYQDDTKMYPEDWKKWRLGSDGYPTFID